MNLALMVPTLPESIELRKKIMPHPVEEMKTIFEGELLQKQVKFTHCGVGKVNAAHSTTLLLENHDVDILILFGIGGAYSGSVGDISIAESENYGEEGVLTENGWHSMEFTGLPLLKNEREYYNTFQMDMELVKSAVKASEQCGFKANSGNFVTVSQCSGTRESGKLMRKRFNGICENMEGAAVAHICTLYNIPLIEIRGISNIIGERDMKKWNIELASSNCTKAVMGLVESIL
jgi:futalosine hydrolase